jgi:hypothetical protein
MIDFEFILAQGKASPPGNVIVCTYPSVSVSFFLNRFLVPYILKINKMG